MDALPEQSYGASASGYGTQYCQESTVQPFRLLSTEESRGLEIQNQLLDNIRAEFQEFPGRRVYTLVEREGIPPSDADRPPATPRVVQEEEDRTSALIPTLPPFHRNFREAHQGENVLVPSDVSRHLDSDRTHRTTSQNFRNQTWSMRQMSREMVEEGEMCKMRERSSPSTQ